MNVHKFDLFRLNCYLNDKEASDFKQIIISLTCEFIFENGNKEYSINDCYNYIANNLKIKVEFDFFKAVILKSHCFEISPISETILIKLKSEKYASINEKIKEHSIEIYIAEFISLQDKDSKFIESTQKILYSAVYENINSFTIDDIKTILSVNLEKKYSQEEIEVFNDFLDYDNSNKNAALFNVFLKAIEFAILTSGKGIKEFSKELFKDKSYLLDTNIIFRILGVGGEERKESLIKLMKSCLNQGVKFEYSAGTHQEFQRKLDASVKNLQQAENNGAIKILIDFLDENEEKVNHDFITHYSLLRRSSKVTSPVSYGLYIDAEFRNLQRELKIQLTDSKIRISDIPKSNLANNLYSEKKKINGFIQYTHTAAQVDAHNIMYVRAKRGANNYNFADVKSFYLSTDRTLNTILGKLDKINIPETILPSQLYILHHGLYDDSEEIDYDLFLKFLKRRTTEFKYKGQDVLNHIKQVRNFTTDDKQIKGYLESYSNYRFEASKNNESTKQTIQTITEYQKTFFDKKAGQLQESNDKFGIISEKAENDLDKLFRNTRNYLRFLDVFVILLIPTLGLVSKKYFTDLAPIILLVLLLEGFKFILTSKTNVMSTLWKKLLNYRLISSPFYSLTGDEDYIERGLDKIYEVNGDIWKRVK